MEFDTRQQQGRARGGQRRRHPQLNAAVAVDSKHRIYGIESGPCSGGQVGMAHVLDPTLDRDPDDRAGRMPGRAPPWCRSRPSEPAARAGWRVSLSACPWSSPRRSCCRRFDTARRPRSCASRPGSTAFRAPSPRARSGRGAGSARALQLLSEGQAQYLAKEHRELHVLTAFDLQQLHVGLAADLAATPPRPRSPKSCCGSRPPILIPRATTCFRDALHALERRRPLRSRRSASGCSGTW